MLLTAKKLDDQKRQYRKHKDKCHVVQRYTVRSKTQIALNGYLHH